MHLYNYKVMTLLPHFKMEKVFSNQLEMTRQLVNHKILGWVPKIGFDLTWHVALVSSVELRFWLKIQPWNSSWEAELLIWKVCLESSIRFNSITEILHKLQWSWHSRVFAGLFEWKQDFNFWERKRGLYMTKPKFRIFEIFPKRRILLNRDKLRI